MIYPRVTELRTYKIYLQVGTMTGKELEKLIVEINGIYREMGIASVGRYGVQASIMAGDRPGEMKTVVMQSLPDFEGDCVLNPLFRQHLIFDAKVCGQASFVLSKYRTETKGSRSRQLRHMLDRSRFGADCFFLIHWTERQLKTKHEPAITYRFPVLENDFWTQFERGEIKVLTRADCAEYGTEVHWRTAGDRGTKPRPDYLDVLS